MPFLTLRRFRLLKKPVERKRSGYTPEEEKEALEEAADPLTFSVLNLVSKPKRSGSERSGLTIDEKIENFSGENLNIDAFWREIGLNEE